MRRFGVRCGGWGYDGVLGCDVVVWSATRHAASLQRPWGLHRRDLRVWWWVTVGGGIFALRRPRPYSRLCGEIVGGITAPTTIYAHAGIYGNGVEADNDAARCVATSFEERGNRF